MYKMIVCDLDGTLLDSSGKIIPETLNVIKQLKEKGIIFVVATGRLDIMAKEYLYKLGNDINIICCNGCVIKNLATDEILYEATLPPEYCERVFEICKSNRLSYYLFCEGKLFGDDEQNPRVRYMKSYNETLEDRYKMNIAITDRLSDEMKNEKIYKVVISNEDTSLLERVSKEIMSELCVTSMRSAKNILDVFHKDASKGKAVSTLANKLGIRQSEIIAFGDNQNDLDMIEFAGLGVAMGNAEENVKQVADLVTLDNDSNGIGIKLKEIFEI